MHGSEAPSGAIDESKPSVARMYDYLLGGKDHYEVDRNLVDAVGRVLPNPQEFARVNRRFLTRVVRWLTNQAEISQFLDCGSGMPTADNVHQVAQRHRPSARVVYVDHDPVVAAHGRALLAEDERTDFVQADFADIDKLLESEPVARSLDWGEPIAVIQCATLHHVPDARDPWAVMRRLVDALPSGSYIGISHVHRPDDPRHAQMVDTILERANAAGMDVVFRSRADIEALFAGAELVEPGLVRLAEWWPEGPTQLVDPWDHLFIGGLARVP